MNREDIIRMAREADLGFLLNENWLMHEELERFAALVASAERDRLTDFAIQAAEKSVDVAIALEREACANAMAYLVMIPTLTHGALVKLSDVVNAIRARGQA